jgi:hypothetical protein
MKGCLGNDSSDNLVIKGLLQGRLDLLRGQGTFHYEYNKMVGGRSTKQKAIHVADSRTG